MRKTPAKTEPESSKLTVVHVVTRVQSVFGVLDNDGNVHSHTPVNLEVNRLNQDDFSKLLEALLSAKQQLSESGQAPLPGEAE